MHPATLNLLRWFDYDHLPAGPIRNTSMDISAVANRLGRELPEGPELSAGLRKLLEAKDCFVRAAIEGLEKE